MSMKRILVTLAVLATFAPVASAQIAPDTCWVEGYLFGNDMKVARAGVVVIKRIEKPGYLFTWRPSAEAKADSTGFVRFPLPRGSTAYLYSQHLYSISRDQTNGTPIPIPNTPTARLENLPPATSVPSTYVVAVPPQRYRVLENGTLRADTIHTLDVSGAIVTSPSPGTAHLQITGGSVVAYGDSIHVADSIARANADSVQRALARRVFVSRLTAAITLDSTTDAAGRIYYTVSLDPDSVQVWLRDSSMTWMLGRVVQLADSGIAERGYITPTQIRTLLAGYSVTGHAHAIADVTGLATALGDTVSYRDRMAAVEGSIAVILDTINAVRGRLATVVTDLNTHIGAADAHLPSQTGQAGKVLGTDGTVSAWRTLDRTYITRNDTCIVIDSSTAGIYIVTLNPNCRGGGATVDTLQFVSMNRDDMIKGEKTFAGSTRFGATGTNGSITITGAGGFDASIYKEGYALGFNTLGFSFLPNGYDFRIEGPSFFIGTPNSVHTSMRSTGGNGVVTTQKLFTIYGGNGEGPNTGENMYGSWIRLVGGQGRNGINNAGYWGHGGNATVRGGDSGGGRDSARGGSVFVVGGAGYGGPSSTNGNVILAHTDTVARGKVGVGTKAPTELLDVAGNIKASGAMSAKTVVGDSAVVRIFVRDTTSDYATDSAYVKLLDYERPWGGPSPVGGMLYGALRIKIVAKYALTNAWGMSGVFVSDSANGVTIYAMDFVGVGAVLFQGVHSGIDVQRVAMAGRTVGVTNTAYAGGRWLSVAVGERAGNLGTHHKWDLRFMTPNGTNSNGSVAYMTIYYAIPAGNTSLAPVTIVGL